MWGNGLVNAQPLCSIQSMWLHHLSKTDHKIQHAGLNTHFWEGKFKIKFAVVYISVLIQRWFPVFPRDVCIHWNNLYKVATTLNFFLFTSTREKSRCSPPSIVPIILFSLFFWVKAKDLWFNVVTSLQDIQVLKVVKSIYISEELNSWVCVTNEIM